MNIKRASIALAAIAATVGAAFTLTAVATAAGTAVSPSPAYCAVTITNGATTATAHPGNGCHGPFAFTSWEVDGKNQSIYRTTTSAPWVVALPPCFWQVDFTQANGTLLLGKRGGSACPPPTTTTTLPPTTTTTAPPTTTTTAPPPTVVPIPAEPHALVCAEGTPNATGTACTFAPSTPAPPITSPPPASNGPAPVTTGFG